MNRTGNVTENVAENVTGGPGIPLALTMGDPAGIGIEITIAAWLKHVALDLPSFALYADADLVEARAQALGLTIDVRRIGDVREAAAMFPHALPVLHHALAEPSIAGHPSAANAAVTIAIIEAAVRDALAGKAAGVVTNPIAKNVLSAAGFRFPGHTEFLAHLADTYFPGTAHTPVMMLSSPELRVIPLTIHIALKDVPARITREGIDQIVRIADRALRIDFGYERPRIALTGLNPHAGENATMGLEERDVILPAILDLQQQGFDVSGPYPADTLFHAARRSSYDAVVAMYHDQALIPLKTIAFDEGVNVTLGLPFVRTSPDHGTAFDIAGKGIARPLSLIEALRLGHTIGQQRNAAREPIPAAQRVFS